MTLAELKGILDAFAARIDMVERRIDVVQADRADLCALVASIDRRVRQLADPVGDAAGLPLDVERGAT
jgi:hypothetical protein